MIHRIIHPAVLRHPALFLWLKWICRRHGLHAGTPAQIADLCAQPDTQVLLGIEGERPVALFVTQLPSPLMLYPTILLGYNAGSSWLRKALAREVWAFVRQAGFNKVLCTNRSGRSDAAYERGFRPYGKVAARVTTFLVELNKEEEEENEVRSGDRDMGILAA